MLYTSAEAAKLLRRLNEEHERLIREESSLETFSAAVGEDIESVRPEYNYKKFRADMAEIESKIRTVKHAINLFNANTLISEFNMTIDQMLVYLPQLTRRKNNLRAMQSRQPKERKGDYGNFIDYNYANYDIAEVKQDYLQTADELLKAQTALDKINNSVQFEINIEL
ncbi:MAG: hypothetical protein IJ667_00780 [Synergistaceae bacterium]|nr:hypothetical protein [Synergistaceae bacterium]